MKFNRLFEGPGAGAAFEQKPVTEENELESELKFDGIQEQNNLEIVEKGRLENFFDKIKPKNPKLIEKAKALIEAFFAGRTPEELLEYEIEDHAKIVDGQRDKEMESGVPVTSEEMHQLKKELHNLLAESRILDNQEDDNAEKLALLKKEMLELARTGENMQNVLEVRNLYAIGSSSSERWQDIAPNSKQSPEFLESDALFSEMINRPIPEGELTLEQKDEISEHINEINSIRWSKNKGLSLEHMKDITKNVSKGALATDRIYDLLYARVNRAHWERFIDSDHKAGDPILTDDELSPEYQEVDERFRTRLEDVPYATEMYFDAAGTHWENFAEQVTKYEDKRESAPEQAEVPEKVA